jgi:mannose-1-phosphate guanylyltransferase/mannose-6-phosphate isomerase
MEVFMSETMERRLIRPVILAGGAGTRLWPLSTAERPKHLIPLIGRQNLFEQTLERFGDAFAPPIIVANQAQEKELRTIAGAGARIILEPIKRDSAAAIALAAMLANEDELLLVCPSDHHIGDIAAFHQAIALARPEAEAGKIVTFGIEPDHPATGFGYIAGAAGGSEEMGVRPVARFIEKPPLELAEAMLAQGGHYWNAGIFLASAATWREELMRHEPGVLEAATEALNQGSRDGALIRIAEAPFARAPAKSIDYAVMEQSDRVAVIPVSMGWSDVGSWTAVFDASPKDEHGNVVVGEALVLDGHANLIRSDGPRIAAIGVNDLVIIASGDSVLVTKLSEAQRVREAAEWFERQGKGKSS